MGDLTVGIDFAIESPEIVDFLRAHDFIWTRRNTGCVDVETLWSLMIECESQGWSIKRLAGSLTEAFGWESAISQIIAQVEILRAANAGAVARHRKAGVTRKVWIASRPPDCLYCGRLKGTVIGIDDSYLKPGELLLPRRNMHPLAAVDAIDYPPLHGGCTCSIGAKV